MKKKALIFSALLAIMSFTAAADVVSGISFAQRWPWNGKIDINYTLEAVSQKTTPVFAVNFYGRINEGEPFELSALEGDGVAGITLGAGVKRATWNAGSDVPGLLTDALQIGIVALDVTEQANYLKVELDSGKVNYSPTFTMSDTAKSGELWLRREENGSFTMGSPAAEIGHNKYADESQHQVTLTKSFYIGVFETTQRQYELIAGSDPSALKGSMRPVDSVTYSALRGAAYGATWPLEDDNRVDRTSFFGKLRDKTGNGLKFDLPTEAMWEYACRAGTTTAWNNGEDITNALEDPELNKLGRYAANKTDGKGGYSEHTTVGSYLPNDWGLYDMHGNVCEWVLDRLGNFSGDATDPEGPSDGDYRVLKGGRWSYDADDCRAAGGHGSGAILIRSFIGFRAALFQ